MLTNSRIQGIIFTCRKYPYKKIGGVWMADKVKLACTECKNRNYDTTKNKKNHQERLELRKYCPFCKKHTVHKETK